MPKPSAVKSSKARASTRSKASGDRARKKAAAATKKRKGPLSGAPQAASPGSRREGARARMYHDLVFESAECVFGRSGFEQATMQDVASEAGISLKTLYAHFAGKQDIYEEIQRVRGAAFVEFVLERTGTGRDPLARLALWSRAYVDFLFAHRDWLHIHLQIRASWGLRPSEGYAAKYWQQGLDGVGGILSAGMKSGVFHKGDSTRLAAIVLAIMQVQVAQAVEADETDAEAVGAAIMIQLGRLLCVELA